MKRLITLTLLSLLSTGVALAEPMDAGKALSVRTFQFKYKDADRGAAAIKHLVSNAGSISIQPATNALVVTDGADNMKAIAQALAEFDSAPRSLKFSVHLVAAAKNAEGAAPIPELRDIGRKLAILGYSPVENLGEANVEAREGDPGSFELTTGYRAAFHVGELDSDTDSITLSDFKLSRLQKDQLVQLYKASLNLKINQPLIFGVTKTAGQRALFLVFVAHR